MTAAAAPSPAVAARMLALRASGASYNAIAAALNQSGVRGRQGGRWFPATVRNALRQVAAEVEFPDQTIEAIKESQCKV